MDEILLELAMRELYLREVVKSGVRDQRQVTSKILGYRIEQRTKNDDSVKKVEEKRHSEMAPVKSKTAKHNEHELEKPVAKDE